VGRVSELEKLEQSLLPQNTGNKRSIAVLHGLGGIGKTQLAVQFARKHQNDFDSAFWLDGSTDRALKHSIAAIAKRLPDIHIRNNERENSPTSGEELDNIVHQVLNWFSIAGNTKWLLIFDNVDRDHSQIPEDADAYNIQKYFPDADQGAMLITTRLRRLGLLGTGIALDKISQNDALNILERLVGHEIRSKHYLFGRSCKKCLKLNKGGRLRYRYAASTTRWPSSCNCTGRRLYESNIVWRVKVPTIL
jgi:hypothetical protein